MGQLEFNPRRLAVVAIKTFGWAIVGLVVAVPLTAIGVVCQAAFTPPSAIEREAARAEQAARSYDIRVYMATQETIETEAQIRRITTGWVKRLQDEASFHISPLDFVSDVGVIVRGRDKRVSYLMAADAYGRAIMEFRDTERAALATCGAADRGELDERPRFR